MRMQNQSYKKMADKFKALSHPLRLKIAYELMTDECCVGDVQKCLSISQPNVSQHLKVLKNAEIISGRREGNKICYRVSDEAMKKILKNIFKEKENGKNRRINRQHI